MVKKTIIQKEKEIIIRTSKTIKTTNLNGLKSTIKSKKKGTKKTLKITNA